MADIELTLSNVSVPANTSGSITLYEDVGADGSGSSTDPNGKAYDNSDTVSLVDGTTSYTLSGFDASAADLANTGNEYWLEHSLSNSDVESTARVTYDVTIERTIDAAGVVEASSNASGRVTGNFSGVIEATTTASGTGRIASEGTYYYVNDTPVNGELSTYPDVTIGEETSFEFYIKEDNSLSQSADDRYNELKELLKYAGYATTSQTLGSAYYTEPADYDRADVDTLLVYIRPGSGVDEARGVWGVVTGGSDDTEIFGAIARVNMTVFVLGEYDSPALRTVSDVEREFKSEI